jgi:hypothetical protein
MLKQHWQIFKEIVRPRWLRWIGGFWFVLGIYDLVV